MDETEFPKEFIEESPEEKPQPPHESLYAKIMNMGVSEKIKLATLGNREARNLLIRDPNRMIIQAVLDSPRLTDDDVAGFAANRNLSQEVTRIIANKKEFLKNYSVQVALVQNPKTPLPSALKLLNHLRENDLRKISKSKNIPSVLARAAIRTLAARGKA